MAAAAIASAVAAAMAAAAVIASAAAAAMAAAVAAIASAAAAAAVVTAAAVAAVSAAALHAAAACPRRSIGEGKGVVKFFNAQKGFGFVVRDDGGEDVFVHISAVEQAGLTGLAEGQPLEFTLVDRGGRVSATDLKIEGEPLPVEDRGPPRDRDAGPGAPRGGAGGAGAPQRQLTGEKASGTVKFFNAMKGFGFIQRDDGQPDAFVHISAVERAGMTNLNEGDRLEFELEVDRRGKYAAVNLTSLA